MEGWREGKEEGKEKGRDGLKDHHSYFNVTCSIQLFSYHSSSEYNYIEGLGCALEAI